MSGIKKEGNPLATERIGKLIARFAIPAIISMLVSSLYNIVDQIFIGQGVGMLGNAATNIAFPVSIICTATALLLGIGSSSNYNLESGAGNSEKASQIVGTGLAMLVICGIVISGVVLVFLNPLLQVFGVTLEVLPYAQDYTGITAFGIPFLILTTGGNHLIRADRSPTYSMACMLTGAIINTVLDPLFIFIFRMGVQGAALATILSQGVSACWVVGFLCSGRSGLRIRPRNMRLEGAVVGNIAALGVAPFIMQSTESLVNIALNASLKHYGSDLDVGAMTICSSVMQVFFMPFHGLAQGAQPIIGFNYGAGQLERVKETFRLLFRSAVTLSVLVWAAVELFPGAFVALFNDKPELVEAGVKALRVYMACAFMMGIQSACQQSFVALGQAKISLFLALLRKVILLIPLIFILPLIFTQNQVFAVYLAEPVADALAVTTTAIMFAMQFRPAMEKLETGE